MIGLIILLFVLGVLVRFIAALWGLVDSRKDAAPKSYYDAPPRPNNYDVTKVRWHTDDDTPWRT